MYIKYEYSVPNKDCVLESYYELRSDDNIFLGELTIIIEDDNMYIDLLRINGSNRNIGLGKYLLKKVLELNSSVKTISGDCVFDAIGFWKNINVNFNVDLDNLTLDNLTLDEDITFTSSVKNLLLG